MRHSCADLREHVFVPARPSYSKEQAAEAIAQTRSWADALRFLGLTPRGKNFSTLRKWATHWGLDVSHLAAYSPGVRSPRFSEQELRRAIASSKSLAETLRRLGYCPTGGNPRTVKKWAAKWGIATDHFDPHAASRFGLGTRTKRALEELLVEGSKVSRYSLKERLYESGLKRPECELCGQDESWRGVRISMILDHINGVRDDNRLENLQIVCPNCAAGLDTHCGRSARTLEPERRCLRCGEPFRPKRGDHRYCSRACGQRSPRSRAPRPGQRRVDRPPRDQLLDEVKRLGFRAVGRKYGVSDNAIRKWIRTEEARSRSEGDTAT
ncbi:hypothetical protein HJD18_12890 [Thermoleophilia bacterium SCSIO 60948]|nr:hypothetical protein HJD18_12890 [Thermoleophilia bacterium SCSIO 60948]